MTTAVESTESRHAGSARPRSGLPFAAVLGLVTGLAILLVARDPFRDVDIYWHLIAGEELAAGASPRALGLDWSFAPDPHPWVSTQWLGEWALHLIHTLGGWTAIAAYRVVTAVIAIAVLAWTTLRGRPPILAGFPFVVGVVAISAYSQERTQQISYIGAAALGGVVVAGLTQARLPKWWILLPATILWANIHGAWILLPVSLGMVAVGRFLDHGPADRAARRAVLLACVTLAAGAVSPAAFANVTAVVRISRATDVIQEWQPVTPTDDAGILTLVLWLIVMAAWAGSGRVPRGEMLVTASLFVFSWMAWRNVVVAVLLLVPLVAQRLVTTYPSVGRRPEPKWSAPAGIGFAAVCAVGALAWLPTQEPLPKEDYPFALAAGIAELPPGQRVLNDYNLAGIVLQFGGDTTQVGIDGRTDRYGADYIEAYTGMETLRGDWQGLLNQLDPTSALLEEGSALAHVLQAEKGWRAVDNEVGYVLLVAPS